MQTRSATCFTRKAAVAAALLASMAGAQAQHVITFELDDAVPVTQSYVIGSQNFSDVLVTFDNFAVITNQNAGVPPATMSLSGYNVGATSGVWMGFNNGGDPATMSFSTAIDLISGYFGSAWRDGMQVRVDGYANGVLKYDHTFVVDTHGPQLIGFGWAGVDSLRFSSGGGVNVDPPTIHRAQFTLDDLQFNVTPVPEANGTVMGIAGLMVAAWSLRRRGPKATFSPSGS